VRTVRLQPERQGGRIVSTKLAGLLKAGGQAGARRRALGAIPGVFRASGDAQAAYARCQEAGEALSAARHEAGLEAGS
jgi:hypothetical protein